MKHAKSKAALAVMITSMLHSFNCEAATEYWVPDNNEFKSYMDYRTITCKTSAQYQLQDMSLTNDIGIRTYNGRYCIAIGTGYNAPVGTYVDVVLEDGTVIPSVVGDIKDDRDTYENNRQCRHNNSVVEFLVDSAIALQVTDNMGTYGVLDQFSGSINHLLIYDGEDLSDPNWQSVVEDFEGTDAYLVTDKYEVELGDTVLYFISYASDNGFNTLQVSKSVYDSKTINYSTISLESEKP